MRASLTIILLTILSITSHADSWCDAGNYSISWYKSTSKEFTINNEKELAGVAYLVNNGYTTFKNATIVLGNDISLNGHEWMAIGSSLTSCFQGTFDGNNHSISDVTITKNSFKEDRYMGFFSCLKDASIKNLSIQFKDFTVDIEQRLNINIGKISGYAEKCQFRNVSAKGNLSLIVGKISFYD